MLYSTNKSIILSDVEAYAQKRWENVHRSLLEPVDVLIDTPPPYTDRFLHLHHAIPHVLAETYSLWLESKGISVLLPQGFDCHSIELENLLDGDVQQCNDEVADRIKLIKKQFLRLGYVPHWSHEYASVQSETQILAYNVCKELMEKGLIYSGVRYSLRCPSCGKEVLHHQLYEIHEKRVINKYTLTVSGKRFELIIPEEKKDSYFSCLIQTVSSPMKEMSLMEPLVINNARIPVLKAYLPNFPNNSYVLVGPELSPWYFSLHKKAMKKLGISIYSRSVLQKIPLPKISTDTMEISMLLTKHKTCNDTVLISSEPTVTVKLRDKINDIKASAQSIEWYPKTGLNILHQFLTDTGDDWPITRSRKFGVLSPFGFLGNGDIVWNNDNKNEDGKIMVLDTMFVAAMSATLVASRLKKVPSKIVRIHRLASAKCWHYSTIVLSTLIDWVLKPDIIVSHGYLQGDGNSFKERVLSPGNITPYINMYSTDNVRWWALGTALGRDRTLVEAELRLGNNVTKKLNNFIELILSASMAEGETLINGGGDEKLLKQVVTDLVGVLNKIDQHLARFEYVKSRLVVETLVRKTIPRVWLEKDLQLENGEKIILQRAVKYLLGILFLFVPACSEFIYGKLNLSQKPLREDLNEILSNIRKGYDHLMKEIKLGGKE
ncbi:MAG: class I tRNA ligase family protein [Pseudomonadota bacterium]